MTTLLTDHEYAEARNISDAPLCPSCKSARVIVTVPLRWDEENRSTGLATEVFRCESCLCRWTEILRPIAYELEGV